VHRGNVTGAATMLVAALALTSRPSRAEGRTHEGFQFRGAVGFGYISDDESRNANLHGGAGVLEVYLGGTPARGLVIGGFLSGASAIGPSVSVDGFSASSNDTRLTLFTVGPYIDYYPNPHGGFHVLGTLGFADLTASYDDGTFAARDSGTGITLGGGIGYDWWVSRDWSLGILGRFTFASTRRTVDGFSVSEDTVLPAVLFSFSYQ
jgi:hypothetical protein